MHADDDALWALALGEDADPSAAGHVRGCPDCSAELAERARVVAAGRRQPPSDLLLRPPPRVLEAVRAELGLAGGPSRGAPDAPTGAPASAAVLAGVPAQRRGSRAAGPRRRVVAALAALAGVVLGLGGAALAGGLGGPEEGAGDVVARASLEPLGDRGAGGTAVLRQVGGVQQLEVVVERADAPPGTYQEVWLVEESGGLLSLGALADGHGVFTVPQGAVGEAAPLLVDVSDEPLDGRPEHSGASLARGPLQG